MIGKTRGGIRFGVGSRNPFAAQPDSTSAKSPTAVAFIRGEHEPIVEQGIFDAVQARLAAGSSHATASPCDLPAILAGRIFDARGNRMTPTHTNKKGARYRYYVCHAVLHSATTVWVQ